MKIASATSFTRNEDEIDGGALARAEASSPATASEITIAGTLISPPANGPASSASGTGQPAERITPAA